jgi:cell division protease FtsH
MLDMFFGGRAAEELVFGPDKVTAGASNDIERATGLARRMVTQFGMSDSIGMMAVGDREQEIFLGREFGQRREVSERTAEAVDDEVKKLLDGAYVRAMAIVSGKREMLDRMVAALMERETLDREEVELLYRGEPLRPKPPAQPPLSPPAIPAAKHENPAPQRAPILGAPPAEPAGA